VTFCWLALLLQFLCRRHPFDSAKLVFRYCKFDTFTPAAERGLPVTRVISRMTLQQILARAVGDDAILNGSHVVDFIDDGSKVNGQLYFYCHAT
jgi:zeaxanthin epoxidase